MAMRYLNTHLFLLAAVPVFLALVHDTNAGAAAGASIERGKYLVEQVAMCVECHTPRDQSGQLIRAEYLRGAPVPVKAPPYPNLKWAIKAPAIAGLPGYNKGQGVRLLTEGITASGKVPDPPMPRFRLTPADAEAVVAYLKSLP
jgi:mono/diheme cytochrome c family protein